MPPNLLPGQPEPEIVDGPTARRLAAEVEAYFAQYGFARAGLCWELLGCAGVPLRDGPSKPWRVDDGWTMEEEPWAPAWAVDLAPALLTGLTPDDVVGILKTCVAHKALRANLVAALDAGGARGVVEMSRDLI